MPLFEIIDGGVSPFEHVLGGPDLYEQELEQLLWNNLADLLGESMLKVRRQAHVAGGRPDILALDATGSVVAIEIKRSVDRQQLSQCLEYAGWARTTKLEQIASLYSEGVDAFWSDWPEFTETAKPRPLSSKPRVVLVAQYFDVRTRSAIDFLSENGVPISLITVSLHQDGQARRIIEVGGIGPLVGPVSSGSGDRPSLTSVSTNYSVTLGDLVDAGYLAVGDQLIWERPRKGVKYACSITADHKLALEHGDVCATPSGAASAANGGGSFDGWNAWWSPRREVMLHRLRSEFLEQQVSQPNPDHREDLTSSPSASRGATRTGGDVVQDRR